MRYVIVDLEATCWEKGTRPGRMEIIEIGAVVLRSATGEATSHFEQFVRPIEEPVLSEFCMRLTGIRQSDIDAASTFPEVFERFLEWIGPEDYRLCSWGAYDLKQFYVDCRRHRLAVPAAFERHVNLKQAFADLEGIAPCGMQAALRRLNLPAEGSHHRALDDARNVGRIAGVLLRRLEGRA